MDPQLENTFINATKGVPLQIPSSVTVAKQRAAKLTAEAGARSAAQPTVGDILKKKALEAYGYNQDLIGKLDPAIAAYVSAPSVAREKFKTFDPFAKQRLVSQYVGSQAIPMQALSSVLGQRFGRVDDIVGAGTRRYEAETTAALNKAKLAQTDYQDAMSEWSFLQQLSGQREDRGLAREKFEWEKTQPTGGGTATERVRSEYLTDLIRQVREGMTLENAISTYGDSLSRTDILNTYNDYSPYGSYGETPQQVESYFNPSTNNFDDLVSLGFTEEEARTLQGI